MERLFKIIRHRAFIMILTKDKFQKLSSLSLVWSKNLWNHLKYKWKTIVNFLPRKNHLMLALFARVATQIIIKREISKIYSKVKEQDFLT